MKQKTHKNEVKYNPFENVEIKKSNIDFSEITHYHKNPKDMVEASFLFKGNTQRMKKLMQKAKNGDKINFTVLGGSITEGSGHSDGEYYGDVLNKWFKENFKQSEICYVNSGRGTTTSLFGSARIQRDILPLNCDLVIVEYAVNDTILEKHIAREAFEGLLIKLLSLPSKPCVMILFSCMGGLGSAQDLDLPIGIHYNLPMASLHDAIVFHLKQNFGYNYENEMTEQEISDYVVKNFIYDGCHPDTKTYSLLCDFITHQLTIALNNLNEFEEEYILPNTPIYSNRFISSHIENNEVLNVSTNIGWEKADRDLPYIERGFITQTPNAQIVFEFECKILTMVSRKSISPKFGTVLVEVDNNPPFEIDGFFLNGWGTYNDYKVIIDEQQTSHHTVKITFTGNKSKDVLSKGKEENVSIEEIASKFIISEFLPA